MRFYYVWGNQLATFITPSLSLLCQLFTKAFLWFSKKEKLHFLGRLIERLGHGKSARGARGKRERASVTAKLQQVSSDSLVPMTSPWGLYSWSLYYFVIFQVQKTNKRQIWNLILASLLPPNDANLIYETLRVRETRSLSLLIFQQRLLRVKLIIYTLIRVHIDRHFHVELNFAKGLFSLSLENSSGIITSSLKLLNFSYYIKAARTSITFESGEVKFSLFFCC